ncbi:Uncharacterised protein [Mycobacteroides abscessus subsp. abscessus]|nr:Uncharacterised protein [Mycobacteroides abscessus subsp. abscessus]
MAPSVDCPSAPLQRCPNSATSLWTTVSAAPSVSLSLA